MAVEGVVREWGCGVTPWSVAGRVGLAMWPSVTHRACGVTATLLSLFPVDFLEKKS